MSGANATANFALELNATGGAPAWIMLLPPGKSIPTVDSRGPWLVDDPAKVVAASLQGVDRIPVDENHSLDLAASKGEPSPARGWIVELQARPDGVFGRVEWTKAGAELLADKAYRFISPVIEVAKGKTNVLRILRASLVNNPNLRGMVALNAEGVNMDLLTQLRKILGLADDADAEAVCAKVRGMLSSASNAAIAKAAGLAENADATAVLNAVTALADVPKQQLAPIATAAGLKDDADPTAVLNAVTALATAAKGAEGVAALQSELSTVTTKLNALTTSVATERATAFVDGAIKAGRVGVKPMRDHYIERHANSAESAATVEKEINAMPILGPSGALPTPPQKIEGTDVELNAEQQHAAKLLGLDPKEYAKTLKAEQAAAA